MLEKISKVEKEYFKQEEQPPIKTLDMSPTIKKSDPMLFDTEITLLNNNNYMIKTTTG